MTYHECPTHGSARGEGQAQRHWTPNAHPLVADRT